MKIKKIEVKNYRRFHNVSFSLVNDITLLAGANNSGKTSLIEFIGAVISSNKQKYYASDIPINLSDEKMDKLYPIIKSNFDSELSKENQIQNIVEQYYEINTKEEKQHDILASLRFTIDYELEEDIRNFADYIMDLDSEKYFFYFTYTFELTPVSLGKALERDYDKLFNRYSKLRSEEIHDVKIKSFKEKLLYTYASGIVENCYYTDDTACNTNKMEPLQFRKLFNFRNIIAGRPLDDQSTGNYKSISKHMIDIAYFDESWKKLLETLPDQILESIEGTEAKNIVHKVSGLGIQQALESIAEANGGNTGNMILDLDISEEAIISLINNITKAKYTFDKYMLSESSQGLGYSNLIFIILQLEAYQKSIDPLLINFFVIEEPESHMHPQMQNVFGKYLRDYYKSKKIQGIMTTHSSEIVRATEMKRLRVARTTGFFISEILDFSDFKEELTKDVILNNFFNFFYEIGFSDIVFADRVVLYEGDTEKMLIRKLLTFSTYKSLHQKYIAFIQVGGAYAHTYKKLIDFLKIKTLIITDLDYCKDAKEESKVLSSNTTNAAINSFYKERYASETPTVQQLYDWKSSNETEISENIYLSYQGKEESYARTLEEAMLCKLYNMSALEQKSKVTWNKMRLDKKLKFTIPQKDGDYSIRDIVQHTSSGKTDFMYSIILESLLEKSLPHYIEEGLKWLAK